MLVASFAGKWLVEHTALCAHVEARVEAPDLYSEFRVLVFLQQ
jgi:hypothetical protein